MEPTMVVSSQATTLLLTYWCAAIHLPNTKPLPNAKRPVTLPHNFDEILFQSSSSSRVATVRHKLPKIQHVPVIASAIVETNLSLVIIPTTIRATITAVEKILVK